MKKNYLSQFLPTLKDGVSLGNPNDLLIQSKLIISSTNEILCTISIVM